MMLRNHVSRFHVAIHAIRAAGCSNERVKLDQHKLVSAMEHEIRLAGKYILKNSKGMLSLYVDLWIVVLGVANSDFE